MQGWRSASKAPPKRSAAAFDLAAACCSWPADDAAQVRVREAALGVDWPTFLVMVRRHRIEGLAAAALACAGVEAAPIAADLSARARQLARQGLLQAAESARLQRALDAAGAPSLVLKGAALDMLAWGRLGLKQAWDIDLLVTAETVETALSVLRSQGYDLIRPQEGPERPAQWGRWLARAKECVLQHRASGLIVELHWRLVDAPRLLPGLGASDRGQVARLGGVLEVRTLAPGPLFAYLCVHGASHGWARLKWLADLNALIAPVGEAALLDLHAKAARLGAGRCATVALALTAEVFGRSLPPPLVRVAHRDLGVRLLLALARAAMTAAPEREPDERLILAHAIRLSSVLFAPAPSFILAELRRHLARPPLWAWRRLRRVALGAWL